MRTTLALLAVRSLVELILVVELRTDMKILPSRVKRLPCARFKTTSESFHSHLTRILFVMSYFLQYKE